LARSRRSRALQLFSLSLRMLARYRALLAFPLLSLAASLVVVAGAVAAIALLPTLAGRSVAVFCGYLVLACVIVFCNAALIHCADAILAGRSSAVADGWRAAGRRAGVILVWALISATVSLVLRVALSRFGLLGRLLGTVGALTWTLLTYLVLPVLVLEGAGPRAGVRRSSELFKRTWGERVAGQLGLGWITALLIMPAIIVLVLGASLSGGPAGIVAGGALAGAWVLAVAVTMAAVAGIYQTALYRYAVDGTTPGAFSGLDLGGAFGPGRGR
jgi:hypothetical protein